SLAPDGLAVEGRANLFGLDSFRKGWFEVQDEASQLCADLVAPPPGGTIVDACAGAGGKTLALGSALGGKGRIFAFDVDERKLVELRKRAARAGLNNVAAMHPEKAPPGLLAARVLVDAPCTGLGVLRRNPEARWRITEAEANQFGS